jgi:hypothetical protein
LEKLDGQDQSELLLVAHQYSLNAFQRTALDSNPVPAFQERIGFNLNAARDSLANGLNLRVGNDRGHACEPHQAQDAGRGQDFDLLFQFSSQEDVAGKQWCGKFPGSITPLPTRSVLRQEYLESFVDEGTRRQVLMLVPGVDCHPTGA